MSLMGSLYIGTSGLQTSQNALNTTAHNMSNVDTPGYTRQIVQQATRHYNVISANGSAIAPQQIGLGVVYSETKTQRDYFLDKSYRQEAGRSAFYETSAESLMEIEDLLQELEGEDFAAAIKNLWTSVQDLANTPGKPSAQSVFIQRSHEFLTRADAVYQGLCDYQDNINASIKTDVDRINDIGLKIKELNEGILSVEGGKIEKANDLRDQRDALLDELGKMVNISYDYDVFGNAHVKIEGNDFVMSDSVNEIALDTDPVTGFHTPYWPKLATYSRNASGDLVVDTEGATVFRVNESLSPEMNNDIGSLKSKLLSRGDHRATFQDLEPKTGDPEYYNREISQSALMNVQAEFDRLINKITTGINGVLKDAAEKAASEGEPDYLRGSDGNPLQVFNLISPDGDYSVKNMAINSELRQAPTLLGLIRKSEGEDFATLTKMKELFESQEHVLNPNVATKVNLQGFYNSMVNQVAGTAEVAREIHANQEMTVEQLQAAREQVVGVASDEEMSNMVMFQNAYNASSRYINVISEMLEHIINTLGS